MVWGLFWVLVVPGYFIIIPMSLLLPAQETVTLHPSVLKLREAESVLKLREAESGKTGPRTLKRRRTHSDQFRAAGLKKLRKRRQIISPGVSLVSSLEASPVP